MTAFFRKYYKQMDVLSWIPPAADAGKYRRKNITVSCAGQL